MQERLDQMGIWIENHPLAFVLLLMSAMGLASAIIGKIPTKVVYKTIRK